MDSTNDEGAATAMEAPSGNHRSNPRIAEAEDARDGEVPTVNVWLVPGETGIVTFACPFCQYRGQPCGTGTASRTPG